MSHRTTSNALNPWYTTGTSELKEEEQLEEKEIAESVAGTAGRRSMERRNSLVRQMTKIMTLPSGLAMAEEQDRVVQLGTSR